MNHLVSRRRKSLSQTEALTRELDGRRREILLAWLPAWWGTEVAKRSGSFVGVEYSVRCE